MEVCRDVQEPARESDSGSISTVVRECACKHELLYCLSPLCLYNSGTQYVNVGDES